MQKHNHLLFGLASKTTVQGTDLNDADKNGFMTVIHKLDRSRGLDLILHTPGGETAATESLVDYIRSMFGTDVRAIHQIFYSYKNPRADAETERVIRTTKEEVLWFGDFGSFEEARATIGEWIGEDYNRLCVHSALGYRRPEEFRRQWIQSQEVVLGGC